MKQKGQLTNRQIKFCYEYSALLNATKAAELAGYSLKTSRSIGHRLLTNVDIKSKIQELQENIALTAKISALKIINEHAKMAFSNVAEFHNSWIELKDFETLTEDQKACIQEISTKVVKVNVGSKENPVMADVEYIRIKTYDKQKSLDAISEMLGFNAPKKTELTGKDGKDLFKGMSDEELEAKIKELEAKNRLIDGR